MTTEILKALEQHAESLAQLRGENLNLQLRLDARLDVQAARIGRVESRVGHLVARTVDQTQTLCKLDERIVNIEGFAERLQLQTDTLFELDKSNNGLFEKTANTIRTLADRVDLVDERIADEAYRLECDIEENEKSADKRLTELESNLEDTETTANGAEMDVNDCKIDVGNLERKIESMSSDLSTLSNTVRYG